MKRSFKTTVTLSTITPFLLAGVFLLMGGGHGYYAPAIILFPTGLISFSIFKMLAIPLIILGIIQFPVYGIMIDRADNKLKRILIISAFTSGLFC